MAKQDISIGDLISKIQNGELVLPEMQRRYVWTSTKIRDLLDSLYRNYPSGSILVWESQGRGPERSLDIDQAASPLHSKLLLLDGQQRLTSLTALITGQPVIVRNVKRPIEIMFNLNHPDVISYEDIDIEGIEETNGDDEQYIEDEMEPNEIQEYLKKKIFVVYAKSLEAEKSWITVSDIFKKTDSEILRPLGITSENEDWDKFSHRLKKVRDIKNYMYVMQILGREYDYNEVTEIFVRVNSSGVKLRSSDLALAQITAKWHGSLKIFEDYVQEAKEFGYNIDVSHLVRSLVIFATHQSRFKTVNNIPLEKLRASWNISKDGLNYGLNFLSKNTKIESLDMLSSPFILHPIAALAVERRERLSKDEEKALTRWIYLAHAFGRFSRGSSESLLDSDINTIMKKSGNANDLIEVLERQFGRLIFDTGDLVSKGRRSPLFTMAYLAVIKNNAKDWFTGLSISKKTKGKSHKIEFHHIFPRKILQDFGYEKSEINEIANMAFIGGRTNKSISAKLPKKYLEDIVSQRGEDALTSQLVPTDRNLWKIENYRDFLTARRDLLIKEINSFLK